MLTERILTSRGTLVSTLRRRGALLVVALFPVVFAFSAWGLQGGTAAQEDPSSAKAERANILVSVGGVGRIVQAKASTPIARPTSSGSGGSSGPAASADAPPDAVFPRATGQINRYVVGRGARVTAGQPLAVLQDGGIAASAVRQARNDLATARLELRQKRTSDPLKGVPATPDELTAARAAITSGQAKLDLLLAGARRTDVSAAWLDVRRTEADLETLRGGTSADRADAIRVAQRTLEGAQDRLARALTPDPADVSAATAELRKAEAELATLLRAPDGPLPEEIAAARKAVAVAEANVAELTAAVPPVPALIRAAELEVERAKAELARLLQAPKGPLPEEIASARQAVEAARAKLARLVQPNGSAEVKAARVEVERARGDLRKLEAGPSKAALASAQAAVEAAEAKLNQLLGPPLRADVAAARLEIRRAEAELALLRTRGAPASADDLALAQLRVEAAQIRLDAALVAQRSLTVRSPAAGTVTALLSVPGAPVDTTTPIATVTDLDQLAVSVDLSEFDVAQVRPGLDAVVSVDALGGEEFPGKVLFSAATGVETNGVITFPVQVGLTEAAGLRPGMNVSVRINVVRKSNALLVPLEAVSEEEDEPTVAVVNGSGETSTRTVKLGLRNNESAEILKGLREGERVELPELAPAAAEEE